MSLIETFVNSIIVPNKIDNTASIDLATGLIIFSIYIGILLLLGKYLWNSVIVEIIPSLNRINNIWQVLGFIVFLIIIKRI
tara:strand:+ start:298 stop:540 length:243 start_codon:yes stop_codon:yes gene_type:complete